MKKSFEHAPINLNITQELGHYPPPPMEPNVHRCHSIWDVPSFSVVSDLSFATIHVRVLCVEEPHSDVLALSIVSMCYQPK